MGKQEFLPAAKPVAAFDEFRSQLTELQVGNSKAVFDYRSPKGNKEARSHVAKLRTTKAAIEKKRVSEKEEFLIKGRLVDADAKHLTAVVQSMIEVHEKPLKEIEAEEAFRINNLQNKVEFLVTNSSDLVNLSSAEISEIIVTLTNYVIDESFQEFETEAHRVRTNSLAVANSAYAARVIYENEQAELARLRAEALAREQKDREDRIAREAAENARIEGERKAAAEQQRIKDEADRQAREQQLAIERAQREKAESEAAALRQQQEHEAAMRKAEQDRIDAENRAEQQRKQAIENERIRQQQEIERAQRDEEQRKKDKAHKTKIWAEVLEDMVKAGCNEACAKAAINAMHKRSIRHVQINY